MSRNKRGKYPSRKSHRQRTRKKTILIVCKGQETERNYFDQLKRQDRVAKQYAVTIKGGKGGSREQIAKLAVNRKNDHNAEYDEVWCVMDVEGPSHRVSLDKAIKLLKKNGIEPCLSNPAFEVWFLAHFERTASDFKDCDAVIVRLNKHWKKRFKTDYEKNDEEVFQRLDPLTKDALANAKWVREKHHDSGAKTADCNSSTDVYKLVGRLLQPVSEPSDATPNGGDGSSGTVKLLQPVSEPSDASRNP